MVSFIVWVTNDLFNNYGFSVFINAVLVISKYKTKIFLLLVKHS